MRPAGVSNQDILLFCAPPMKRAADLSTANESQSDGYGKSMQMSRIVVTQGNQRGILPIQWGFRFAITVCALIDCWICRFQMDADGVSYLDMGDEYLKGNWHAALNAHWSPLYGVLAGTMLRITKPTMRWEYPVVHLLNFLILIVTLFCFEFFWRELLASSAPRTLVGGPRAYAWVLGYFLFAYIHLVALPLSLVTPDLLVSALVYMASGMMLRFAGGRMGTASAILMGVLLGVGYLAKSAMLPFAVILMITMVAVAWRGHRRKSLIAATLLGCLVISLPFIAALSWKMHRVTFSDTAKLNQGWQVNNVGSMHLWLGDPAGYEHAQHPPRKIFRWPEVYEFATPIGGTYPPWYDPSYWYAGIDSSVHPVLEIQAFLRNMSSIVKDGLLRSGFLVTAALMFILGTRVRDSWGHLLGFWPILAPAVAVTLMFSMVFWVPRYTSGLMLVVWGATMASTSTLGDKRRVKVFWAISLLLGALVVLEFSKVLRADYRDAGDSAQTVMVAERLQAMGVAPGERIAVVGYGNTAAFWARLGGLRIVAEVPHVLGAGDSATAFWTSGPQVEEAVLTVLKSTGARAVIADPSPAVVPPGWVQVGNTGRAVYFFQPIP